ncbi:hypothetical protein ABKV19_014766, partial [Rosa sericea]
IGPMQQLSLSVVVTPLVIQCLSSPVRNTDLFISLIMLNEEIQLWQSTGIKLWKYHL